MAHRDRFGFLCVFGILLAGLCALSRSAMAGESEDFRIVRAAMDASDAALVSGTGEATYKEQERLKGASAWGPWGLKTEAKVKVTFDQGKYRLVLEYSKESRKTERHIIIYDGTAVFSTRFSKGIGAIGSRTEVFPPTEVAGMARPQAARFPWDVSRLSSNLVHITLMQKYRPQDKIEITRSPEGDFLGQYPSGSDGVVLFECPRKFAYNVARKRVFGADRQEPAQEFIATWKKDGDVWYIDSLFEESILGEPDSTRQRRREMRYEKFQANVPVSPEVFTMGALEAPGGSRIVDHRPKTPQPIHYVPHEDKALEKKLGTMVEQLNSLPVERPRVPPAPTVPPSPYRRVLFWSANAAIVLAIVGLSVALWRLRRKRNR